MEAGPSFPEDATHVSGRRFIGHFVDGVLYTLSIFLLIPFGLISDALFAISLILWFTVGHVAYFVLTQRNDGQSPGKQLAGIRVVDAAGAVPDQGALIRRSIPLLFEYLYVIAFISMMSSPYRQRLGDRWGHTYVVRHQPSAA